MLASAFRWITGRATIAVLAIVVCATLGSSFVRAATISFDPDSAEIACHEEVSIDVVIDGVADLRGFSLGLVFSSTFLELVSVDPGPDLVGAPCPHFFHVFSYVPGSSTFMFDGAGLGCSLAGPARVATLVFKGASEGLASLDCSFVDLRNSLNLPIASTCGNASILVSCPVPVRDEAWGTLKARWN